MNRFICCDWHRTEELVSFIAVKLKCKQLETSTLISKMYPNIHNFMRNYKVKIIISIIFIVNTVQGQDMLRKRKQLMTTTHNINNDDPYLVNNAETSIMEWFYNLIHPCHGHDCPHHHHSSSSSGSSSSSSSSSSSGGSDVNSDSSYGDGDAYENISNDSLNDDIDMTSSNYKASTESHDTYWLYGLVGGLLVSAALGTILISMYGREDKDKEASGLVKNRMQSFQYFLTGEKTGQCFDCGSIEMVDDKTSSTDFVRV